MDYKDLYLGGETDMNNNDIFREQKSLLDAVFNVCKGFNNGNPIILSGCVATTVAPGAPIDITEGYIFLDNKIVKVDAHSTPDTLASGTWKYVISTSYDSGGDKLFANGVLRQTWRKERATAVNVAGGSLTVNDLSPTGDRLKILNYDSSAPTANKNKFLRINNDGDITDSDGLIDKGNRSGYDEDWSTLGGGSLNPDDTWRDIDLSGLVSLGSKWVLLRVYMVADGTDQHAYFREKGNTDGTYNITGIEESPIAGYYRADCWIRMNSSYEIQYKINSKSGGIAVGGYM